MAIKQDLIQLLKPYYLFNIILSISYITLKRIPVVCNYLFNTDNCEFDGVSLIFWKSGFYWMIALQRETEILFFLIIVIAMRTRKAGSVSMINYLSSSFLYTKVANLILWSSADYLMGIIFGVIFICTSIQLVFNLAHWVIIIHF